MKAAQIRRTLQAIDILQPALQLQQMNLEDQADVLAILEEQGKSLETITLRELSLVLVYKDRPATREESVCNYPDCKCPFDMGADNLCLIGKPQP